mgnify:FL=1
MTLEEFVRNLTEEYATAEFEYNGKKCGIEPETQNSNTTYTMWYGDAWKDYDNIDDLLSDLFFDGESLQDIFPSIDAWF